MMAMMSITKRKRQAKSKGRNRKSQRENKQVKSRVSTVQCVREKLYYVRSVITPSRS